MAQATRACAVCGEDFTSAYSFQKFCGAKCRRKDRYARTREESIAYSTRWAAGHPEKQAQYVTAWIKRNPEKHARYTTTWRERNPEARREAAAEWRQANVDKSRAASKKWADANPEKVRAKGKRWADTTPPERRRDLRRRWHEANPDANRLMGASRRARRLGNPGSVGVCPSDWASLVRRYGGRCAYCGVKPDKIYMDHVIPLVKGGRDAIGNVLPACFACNASKGSKLLAVWRYRCGGGAFHG